MKIPTTLIVNFFPTGQANSSDNQAEANTDDTNDNQDREKTIEPRPATKYVLKVKGKNLEHTDTDVYPKHILNEFAEKVDYFSVNQHQDAVDDQIHYDRKADNLIDLAPVVSDKPPIPSLE